MKTFEKTWKTAYRGIEIEVHNFWNFEKSGETIYINGRKVHGREVAMASAKLSSVAGLWLEYEENGVSITVKIGTAWHLLGTACQILINGKHHYGNRVVLFAKKPEQAV
ncbi:Uncharacterised protein [Kingella potus]|uniref:Uncharacterized protein n=1 Tax=Kingella potus TaxID=265175 RepID=A0A377R2J5_9NEIS|nr:hypothetical protein [Kingella potus]STR03158.1 Uncharacterised protein [Kingella potus]